MKKLLLLVILILCLTGCFKRDTMEDIDIYTSIYPLEYVTNRLYGEYSNIHSIYPNGVDIQLENCTNCTNLKYTLTDKQLTDYSKSQLFIFNSLMYEKNYVKPMFEKNHNLKIINADDSITEDEFYGLEEMWLNPSRLLSLSRNIKNGFNKYIDNYYLKEKVNNNFKNLKEDLDKLDSKIADTTKKADNKIIVTNNDMFKYLSRDKYGLTVYSLEENANLNKKTIDDVKSLIDSGKIKYIYIRQYDEPNKTIKKLIENTDVEIIKLHMLTNLTENELSNKKDYFSIMNENLDLLRKSLYN